VSNGKAFREEKEDDDDRIRSAAEGAGDPFDAASGIGLHSIPEQ
jgi:hypothetical protein